MVECIKYTPINKKSCLGIANIFVEKWGIEINSITLHQKEGRRWINFPSRMYEDKETKEKKYMPYFKFRDKELFVKFSEEVKKAIDKKCEEDQPHNDFCY